jgi:hypothetical protein
MRRHGSGGFGRIGGFGTILALSALLAGTAVCVGTTVSASAAVSASGTTTTTADTIVAPTTPSDSWLKKAVSTEAKVGSVRISGTIAQRKSKILLSLLVNGDGEGGGSFTQDGSRIQLKRVGTLLYFDAPKKYWSNHATAAQTKEYGGKWIEVDALDTRFQSFDQFLNAGDLAAAVFEGYVKPLTVSKPTKLNGHKVVIVSDTLTTKATKTTKSSTSTVRMYIASTGKPYVLKIYDQGPTQTTTLNFSSYGKAVSITTPPEPINLSG